MKTAFRSDSPNRFAITAALDLRELHGPEVDFNLGVEEPTVDQWESGELVPTPAQVKKLSVLTQMPLAFFYNEKYEPIDWRDTSMRFHMPMPSHCAGCKSPTTCEGAE